MPSLLAIEYGRKGEGEVLAAREKISLSGPRNALSRKASPSPSLLFSELGFPVLGIVRRQHRLLACKEKEEERKQRLLHRCSLAL